MDRIKVYTAITGGFEPKRTDVACFSHYNEFKSERRNAKIFKIMPHLFFPNPITIWLDGNIQFAPGIDLTDFVHEFLGCHDIAVFRHPWRQNIYQESLAVLGNKLDDPDKVNEQLWFYEYDNYSSCNDLAECGVIIRRNTPRVNAFNETWWAQVCAFSSRDQLSFPYTCFKHPKVQVKLNPGNVREDSRFIYTKRQSSKP